MLDRNTVVASFERALRELHELEGERKTGALRPRSVAMRAHEIYCARLEPDEKRPAAETFRKFSTGQLPCPEVVKLLTEAGITRAFSARLDRGRLRLVFTEAIQRLETRLLKGKANPRHIVRRAYELYTRDTDESAIRPSRRTFEWLVYGKTADPEIATLIQTAIRKKDSEIP